MDTSSGNRRPCAVRDRKGEPADGIPHTFGSNRVRHSWRGMLTHADSLRADEPCAGREERNDVLVFLEGPGGHRLACGDIVNTKRALSQLDYYTAPPDRGIDDWADAQMFDGIRAFQKDNGLKVDAFMRPGGPTEKAINANLEATGNGAPDPDTGGVILAAGRKREPNVSIPF